MSTWTCVLLSSLADSGGQMLLTHFKTTIFKANIYIQHTTILNDISDKINIDIPLLICLLFPGEMLLVSFQKSCMKKLNPVPRVKGGSVPIQRVKKSARFCLKSSLAAIRSSDVRL